MTSKIKVDNIADQDDNNIINESGDVITVGASGDTVAVAGNIVKSNAYQAGDGGNIINQCGTTITLGASGDTVSLASGASQTGFGRTGTVNWDTTAKTAAFTAVSGNGYFVNTTSGAITVTLPASPSAGDIVAIADYAGTAATNNITIGRNSSKFEGQDSDGVLDENRDTVTVVYVDATQGWVPVNDNTATNVPPAYVTATGGTVSTCGNFKFHKFTGPGTFCVSCAGNEGGSNKVQILIVAGGGAGGARYGGGGGAGGMVLTPCTGVPISASPFPIAVGGGGTGVPNPCGGTGTPGSNSTAISLTGVGGGGGRHASTGPGQDGGSGGGTGQQVSCTQGSGTQSCQSGNSGTFGFGNDSGDGASGAPNYGHAGGGGAGGVGSDGAPGSGGSGGIGKSVTPLFPAPISGNSGILAGGGGGGTQPGSSSGSGGNGGGGPAASPGTAGVTNTGGGGGGSTGNVQTAGGGGGSGIVIIRYKYQN
jgi:hypothetical protein